jgi:CRISPR-associated protein Csx17
LSSAGERPISDGTIRDLELPGCTPEPLMNYLKALGVLRLVSEQKDKNARGWWKDDSLWLKCPLDQEQLLSFFLADYKPTPLIAAWAGGSGFFKKDNKQAVNALKQSKSERVRTYAAVIRKVEEILREENIADKPRDEEKSRLIRRYRSELPEEVLPWIDAALVLQDEGQKAAPLLGTGGNDGRLDFSLNFMQRIVALGLHGASVSDDAERLLQNALLGKATTLQAASVGQFAPGRVGGPNGTQGMEGSSLSNPWDFILMIEGALFFAGAVVRRMGLGHSGRASFPFTVRAVAAGFDCAAMEDASVSRGELWLPLWSRPCGTAELRQLFGEARAEVSGRLAANATDFARAVTGFGVDRGIAGFVRVGLLQRSGRSFLAAPLGRFQVTARPSVDLLREVDGWLDRSRVASSGKNVPARLFAALRAVDSSVIDFCKYGGAPLFQKILTAVGGIERALALTRGKIGEREMPPLAGLSADWIDAADDGSLEFTVARALASIYDSAGKVGPLRVNLEAVDWKNHSRSWVERELAVVWSAADLPTNAFRVLERRILDGERAGCTQLPLASRRPISLDVIGAFIWGEVNDARIEDLLWGLMLVSSVTDAPASAPTHETPPLPREYALLKLLFLPRALIAEVRGDRLRWRLARNDESGTVIRAEPRIVPLLRAGRVGEACRLAAQRLRSSGLPPIPGGLPSGKTRDNTWCERALGQNQAHRLAAALLLPISSRAVGYLVELVCRQQNAVAEALAVATAGGAND